jgi:hypothetical protein
MPVPRWKRKDPSDIADYWFDWGSDAFSASERFLSEDMTIVAHSVTVPAGLTKISDEHTSKTVRVRVSGGTAGVDYPIDCLITTSDGQVFEQTKLLPVEERVQV